MAKKRTLNEIRQEKTYGYTAPILSDQGGEYIIPNKGADAVATEQMAKVDLDEVKDEIVDKLTKDLHDIFFEHICDEMNKYHIFDIENYIIDIDDPTLPDELQEAWFEYYHGVHGDILGKLMRNITN